MQTGTHVCKCYLCCERLFWGCKYVLDLGTSSSVPRKLLSLCMSSKDIIIILFLQKAEGFRTTNSDYFLSHRCTWKCYWGLHWGYLYGNLYNLNSDMKNSVFSTCSIFFSKYVCMSVSMVQIFFFLCFIWKYYSFLKWSCSICYSWEVQLSLMEGMLSHCDCRFYVLLWILANCHDEDWDTKMYCIKIFWLTQSLYKTVFMHQNTQLLYQEVKKGNNKTKPQT